METTVNKVILINKLNLPSEILHAIKSYVFYNVNEEKKNHSKIYYHVTNDITRSVVRSMVCFDTIRRVGNYWFFMSHKREIILNALFCEKCGNYLISHSGLYKEICCFCHINVAANASNLISDTVIENRTSRSVWQRRQWRV